MYNYIKILDFAEYFTLQVFLPKADNREPLDLHSSPVPVHTIGGQDTDSASVFLINH